MRIADLFKTTIISVGQEEATRIASEAPRAWWDNRSEINGTPPSPPGAIDFTDLNLLREHWGSRDW